MAYQAETCVYTDGFIVYKTDGINNVIRSPTELFVSPYIKFFSLCS